MPAKRVRTKKPTKAKKAKRACFVIMPFGGWFDEYWDQIYRPAIVAAGLEPQRADDVFRPGTIMRDVWLYTRKADVLLADLTSRNGNVFYELGLAHAIGKAVVLISESIDDIPFDLRGLRVVLYERRDPDWGANLRETITAALRETAAAPTDAIPSTFIEERTQTEQPKLSPTEREIIRLRQDVERLKRQMQHGGLDPETIGGRQYRMFHGADVDSGLFSGSYVRETEVRPASLTDLASEEEKEAGER